MKLALNGINCGALISANESTRETDREIGETTEAADGSTSATRLTRKRDLSFTTVLLTQALAHAWASLITGAGEVWSFDSNLYGSKGTGPSSATNTVQSAGSSKWGAGKMRVGATTGTITWAGAALNEFATVNGWTVLTWRSQPMGFDHFITRSDGDTWQNGVTASAPTWLTVNSTTGNVTIANATGSAVDYDDLVILPFDVPDEWIAEMYAAASAGPTSALPYLNATGDLVSEQATRVVLGRAEVATQMRTASTVLKNLAVELTAK